MADLPRYPDSCSGTSDDSASTPLWVKVFGIIFAVVILLFVILMFTRGPHGPSRHMPSGDIGGQTPSSVVVEGGALPEGGHG